MLLNLGFLLLSVSAAWAQTGLIVGASVSSGVFALGAASPSVHVTQKLGLDTTKLAYPKENSKQQSDTIYKYFSASMSSSITDLILGIDLFHHDNAYDAAAETEVRDLIAFLCHHSKRLVLGNTFGENSVNKNAVIRDAAKACPTAIVIDVKGIYRKLHSAAGWHGVHAKDVMADAVHLNSKGAKLFGEWMIKRLSL